MHNKTSSNIEDKMESQIVLKASMDATIGTACLIVFKLSRGEIGEDHAKCFFSFRFPLSKHQESTFSHLD